METNEPVPVKKSDTPTSATFGLVCLVVIPLLIPINIVLWKWAMG